jgi:thiol:disulfide interchange protein DsbD
MGIAGLLLMAGSALAADPLPPDQVFRYAIFDAGDALEIDWAVGDGAYLYRDAFGFDSGDPAIVLGVPEMPVGKVHTDKFLGEQTIYRGNFFVRIPYTVNGNKPDELALTIRSRGCLDSGFCYAPQSWTETVALKSLQTAKKLDLGALGGKSQGDFPPPDEVFFPDLYVVDGNTVEVGFRIIPGYYLYKNKISAKVLGDKARAGALELPRGKIHSDDFFGEQEV